MNLTEANLYDRPNWKLIYDHKKEYDLVDLSPASMANLLDRMYVNTTLASQFEWNRNRRFSNSPPKANLNNKLYKCYKTTERFEEKDCYGNPHLNFNLSELKSFGDLASWFEYFIGNWILVI